MLHANKEDKECFLYDFRVVGVDECLMNYRFFLSTPSRANKIYRIDSKS